MGYFKDKQIQDLYFVEGEVPAHMPVLNALIQDHINKIKLEPVNSEFLVVRDTLKNADRKMRIKKLFNRLLQVLMAISFVGLGIMIGNFLRWVL